MLEASVGLVADLVDSERRDDLVRVRGLVGGELHLDTDDPLVEEFRRPRIQRRKGADDSGLALRDDEIGSGDNEHRRADDRQPKVSEDRRQVQTRHSLTSWFDKLTMTDFSRAVILSLSKDDAAEPLSLHRPAFDGHCGLPHGFGQVGWAWQVRAMSSEEAPNSIATAASPIMLPTSGPIMCTPRTRSVLASASTFTKPSVVALTLARAFAVNGNLPTLYSMPAASAPLPWHRRSRLRGTCRRPRG